MKRHRKSKRPLYLGIADDLRAGILEHRWQPGDLLPSEPQLCRDYGVSRGTAVRAIEVLLQEGLAQRRQGVGTFVARPSLHRQLGFLNSFSETVSEQGGVPSHKLLSERRLSRKEAMQFGCDEAAHELHRLRLVDGVPWALHRCLIPASVAGAVPELGEASPVRREAPDFSLYRALEAAGFTVDHAEELLQARAATADEARLLEMEPGAPLMMVHRKSFDATGRLLELIEAIYNAESYTYEARLVRRRDVTRIHPVGSDERR